jgi:Peptidoglycan-binding protein, CsiV
MALTLDAPQGGRYALQETRRVRTGERHYFDHPAFGVIATVTSLNSGP